MSEAPDARGDSRPMVSNFGEGAELRIFLEDLLQIPRHARRFSVTFEIGQAVVVSVDYLPRESASKRASS